MILSFGLKLIFTYHYYIGIYDYETKKVFQLGIHDLLTDVCLLDNKYLVSADSINVLKFYDLKMKKNIKVVKCSPTELFEH